MRNPMQTRVLLVDGHEIMRDGLRVVLERESDLEVVGHAGDGAAAVRAAQQFRPDVIVMDADDAAEERDRRLSRDNRDAARHQGPDPDGRIRR